MYIKYLKDCREFGIICPIIPGLLPIQNYNSFKRIINLCRTSCPQELGESLEKVKNDDEKIKELGIDHCTRMCLKLIENGVLGLHFSTGFQGDQIYQCNDYKYIKVMIKYIKVMINYINED